MDKYIRESVRRNQKKRRDMHRKVFICACCITLGYVMGNLSCLALVMFFAK